jgi:8-oxo-dGTP pyrophosphatase MutT (NUDIX family)
MSTFTKNIDDVPRGGIIVFDRSTRKYLVIQGMHKGKIGKFGFPKGQKDPTDHDTIATAIREMNEETGVLVSRDLLSESRTFRSRNHVYYYVNADQITIPATFNPTTPEEIANISWMTVSELRMLPESEVNSAMRKWLYRQPRF